MSQFFPALAHTDVIGYLNDRGERRLASIRSLMPPRMSSRFLTSLSYNEEIHYDQSDGIGDPQSTQSIENHPIESVFVDCGAFHYTKMAVPRFKMGGYVSAKTAFREYQERHLTRGLDIPYLLCSPDHIIAPNTDDGVVERRREFTLTSARIFIDLCDDVNNATAVGVVHGRNMKERAEMTRELVEIGYEYIAFGGLVPLSRNQAAVISQLTGSDHLSGHLSNVRIGENSPLGIAKSAGVKTHLFGLNSPDWYRWSKRLGVDSFDGSKLSTEGAVNGIIWIENEFSIDKVPKNASALYRRLGVKNIGRRERVKNKALGHFEFSDDGGINPDNPAWEYLMSARCTSPKCPHGPDAHNCDPRVTGSIEHNMGRTLLNAWTFDSLMEKIDRIYEESKNSDDDNLVENWSPIEVE
jgi:hypothetical protein